MEPIPESTAAIEEFGPFGEEDLLQRLSDGSEKVRGIVPDCVGISLASCKHDVTLTLVATDQEIALLDAVQYLSGGPCVDAVHVDRVVTFEGGDRLDEESWHHFALATAAARVASTLTLPLLDEGVVVGSVNLYAASTSAFAGHHEAIARIFDAWAPGAVTNADISFSTRIVAEQAPRILQQDLDVHVAVGILAAARGTGIDDAFDDLRSAARRAGVTVADLAASLIEIEKDHGAGLDD
jgi:GAF domain-containing protein